MVTVEVGKTVTVGPVVTVSVAVSYLDVSVLLMALTVTVKDVLLLVGAVNFPVVSMVPMVLFPPKVSFTYHFTPAVSELGVTEYANCCVLCSLTVAVFGLTVTVMVLLVPQPAHSHGPRIAPISTARPCFLLLDLIKKTPLFTIFPHLVLSLSTQALERSAH